MLLFLFSRKLFLWLSTILISCCALISLFAQLPPVALAKTKLYESNSSPLSIIRQARMRKKFDQINAYLESNIASESIEKNMNAIDRWINSLIKRAAKFDDDQVELLKGLTLFLELSFNDVPTIGCSRSTYQTLMKNNEAMNDIFGRIKKSPKQKLKRRIERILFYFARQHSDSCHRYYLDEHKKASNLMDPNSYERVKLIVGELIKLHLQEEEGYLKRKYHKNAEEFIEMQPIEASEKIKSIKTFATKRDYLSVAELILQRCEEEAAAAAAAKANAEAEVAPKNNDCTARKLFNNSTTILRTVADNLYEPCNRMLITYQLAFEDDYLILPLQNVDSKDESFWTRFYQDLILYRGCQLVIPSAAGITSGLRKNLKMFKS